MKRLDAYAQPTHAWTRIELLIAAFDGVITRLEQARSLIEQNQSVKAQQLLLRSQRILLELYSGIDVRYGIIPENMSKIYLFALGNIGLGKDLDISSALHVLKIIRKGFESIREEASQLERSGQISTVSDQTQILQHIVA